MKTKIIERGIAAFEKKLGVTLEYLRVISREAPGALVRLFLFMPLAAYRRRVSGEVLHVARIGAVMVEDCGECLEITVNVARSEGVAPAVIAHALRGRTEKLRPELVEALDFGRALVAHDPRLEERRAAIERRFGKAGVVELSVAVASAQLFPTLKRGMGLSRACDVDSIRLGAA